MVIQTTPDSASVYANGKFIGISPVVVPVDSADSVEISVSQPGYSEWSATVWRGAGDTAIILAPLRRISPSLSVFVDPPGSEVILDGQRISAGSVVDYMTTIGVHQLVVRNDSMGRSTEAVAPFKNPERYFYRAKLGTVIVPRIPAAFLVPGSVQMTDGEYVEGAAMLVGNIALGYFAFHTQQEYTDRVSQYDQAVASYGSAGSDAEATRRHDEVQMRKDDMDKYYALRTATFAVFVGGYLYTVIDALLHHLVGDVVEFVPLRETPSREFPATETRAQVRIKF
jgi:hypothetical protein